MKVTRDVIYDLLPSYFAGEVSADTRALIEEFLATDSEFARMTARFRTLYEEHPPVVQADTGGAREKTAFHRARSLTERRNQSFGGAIGFTLGALLALAMGLLRGAPEPRVFVIAIVFGAVGLASWISWYVTGRRLTSS
jgi:anti-sigma factor RsiW